MLREAIGERINELFEMPIVRAKIENDEKQSFKVMISRN